MLPLMAAFIITDKHRKKRKVNKITQAQQTLWFNIRTNVVSLTVKSKAY